MVKNKADVMQVWGFESHNGSRYFVRRVAVRAKDGKNQARVKLIYDFNK